MDDAGLVALAADGDDRAWDELVGRFEGLLRAIARRYRLNDADAADVAQATWTKLHGAIDQLREPGKVGAWLASTAGRECGRITGRRITLVDLTATDVPESEPSDPAARLVADELRQAVQLALRVLSPEAQLLLHLLFWQEHAYERIADELQMPIGSIGPTRMRFLKSLARREPGLIDHLRAA